MGKIDSNRLESIPWPNRFEPIRYGESKTINGAVVT